VSKNYNETKEIEERKGKKGRAKGQEGVRERSSRNGKYV
jgi:hypothetical protein